MSAPTRPDHLTRGYSATAAIQGRSGSPSGPGMSGMDIAARHGYPLSNPLGHPNKMPGASRSGTASPSHEMAPGSSRLFSKRAREIQAQEGIPSMPLNIWGGPPTSGNSTPLRENIPESPTDGFPGFSQLPTPDSLPQNRRARAGTVPSRFSPGGAGNGTLGVPGLAASSARVTPSQSPFRRSPSPNLDPQDAFSSATNQQSSTSSHNSNLLSRLRAGSMPQRSHLGPSPNTSSPFGPSIFSSWNPATTSTGRERGSTLASIASVGSNGLSSPAQSHYSREGTGETDVHMRTLDYLGLAETPQQPRAQMATPYMPNDYLQSSRFRSYSVNNKDKYAEEEDETYADAPGVTSQYAAIQDQLAATQAAIHNHNLAVQAFVNQANVTRPRARTAGVLDTPGSRLNRTYMNSSSAGTAASSQVTDARLQEAKDYNDLPHAVAGLGLGRSNSHNTGMLAPDEQGLEGPTSALWLGSIPTSTTTSTLIELFKQHGPILSARVLTHKNCGFVNFERLDSAIAAKAAHNGKEIFPGAGPVRINFAKPASGSNTPGQDGMYPSPSPDPFARNQDGARTTLLGGPVGDGAGPAPQMTSANPASLEDLVDDILAIVAQFGASEEDRRAIAASLDSAVQYSGFNEEIPAIKEPSMARTHDAPKLREIRKRIESGSVDEAELEEIVLAMLPEIAELSSDYLGNTVVQKLFERRQENDERLNPIRDMMLQEIGPHMADIGVHKNGTWAAQKIIEVCETPAQKAIIVENLRPYAVALFLDQFGNYVLQGTLKFGTPFNDYLFETMMSRLWDVAQGRFGARAMRASLESHHASRNQLRMLAAVIALHSVQLATNANGALLLTWFLDTCTFPQRRTVLAPLLIPHLVHLCTHKVAYLTVLKLINQKAEPEARDQILKALFFTANDDILENILVDANCGATLIFKVLTTPFFDESLRSQVVENVKNVLIRIDAQPHQGYKRLMDEVGMSVRSSGGIRDAGGPPEPRQRSTPRHSHNGSNHNKHYYHNSITAPGYDMGFANQRADIAESFPTFNQGMMYSNAGGQVVPGFNMGMPQMQYQQGMMGRGDPQMGYNFSPGYGGYSGSSPHVDQYRQGGMAPANNNLQHPNVQPGMSPGYMSPGYGMGMSGGNFAYGNPGYVPQDQGNQHRGRR